MSGGSVSPGWGGMGSGQLGHRAASDPVAEVGEEPGVDRLTWFDRISVADKSMMGFVSK